MIFLQSKGPSRLLSNTTVLTINSSVLSFLYGPTLTPEHDLGKTIALHKGTSVGKVLYLLFNMLSRLVIGFHPKFLLLMSWLQSPSAETVELKQVKPVIVSTLSPSIIYEVIMIIVHSCHDTSLLNVEFSVNFYTLHFHIYQQAI